MLETHYNVHVIAARALSLSGHTTKMAMRHMYDLTTKLYEIEQAFKSTTLHRYWKV